MSIKKNKKVVKKPEAVSNNCNICKIYIIKMERSASISLFLGGHYE